jgi:hypothetical protein
LAVIWQETSTAIAPTEVPPADRSTLASLEQRVAELDRETRELMTRIARAEQELAKSEVRAPLSGRVVGLRVRGADRSDGAGAVELEIATADRPLLGRLLDPIVRAMRPISVAQTAAESGTKP